MQTFARQHSADKKAPCFKLFHLAVSFWIIYLSVFDVSIFQSFIESIELMSFRLFIFGLKNIMSGRRSLSILTDVIFWIKEIPVKRWTSLWSRGKFVCWSLKAKLIEIGKFENWNTCNFSSCSKLPTWCKRSKMSRREHQKMTTAFWNVALIFDREIFVYIWL